MIISQFNSNAQAYNFQDRKLNIEVTFVTFEKPRMRERCHKTELRWRGFLLGESKLEKEGGERGDRPLGTGVAEKKREAESEVE